MLVVDDEEPVRRTIRAALGRAGCQVVEARNGQGALTLYSLMRGAVRLVLTDVVMPRLDGVALSEWLRSVDRSTRVLFVSGYADDALEGKGARIAAAALLRKPFSPEALLLNVREVLDEDAVPRSPRSEV